jgi:hypothetical protein
MNKLQIALKLKRRLGGDYRIAHWAICIMISAVITCLHCDVCMASSKSSGPTNIGILPLDTCGTIFEKLHQDGENKGIGNVLVMTTNGPDVLILQSGFRKNVALTVAKKVSCTGYNQQCTVISGFDLILAFAAQTPISTFSWSYGSADDLFPTNHVVDQNLVLSFLQGLLNYCTAVKDTKLCHTVTKGNDIGNVGHANSAITLLTQLVDIAQKNANGELLCFVTNMIMALDLNTTYATTYDALLGQLQKLDITNAITKDNFDKALPWIRYALHTEVQAAVLLQNPVILQKFCHTNRFTMFVSLYQPCRSCAMLYLTSDLNTHFYFHRIDSSTYNDLQSWQRGSLVYHRKCPNLYKWSQDLRKLIYGVDVSYIPTTSNHNSSNSLPSSSSPSSSSNSSSSPSLSSSQIISTTSASSSKAPFCTSYSSQKPTSSSSSLSMAIPSDATPPTSNSGQKSVSTLISSYVPASSRSHSNSQTSSTSVVPVTNPEPASQSMMKSAPASTPLGALTKTYTPSSSRSASSFSSYKPSPTYVPITSSNHNSSLPSSSNSASSGLSETDGKPASGSAKNHEFVSHNPMLTNLTMKK